MSIHRQKETPSEKRALENRSAAGRATLITAGLTVEDIDDQVSLVAGRFEWHRTTNRWQERKGKQEHGYGLLALIRAGCPQG